MIVKIHRLIPRKIRARLLENRLIRWGFRQLLSGRIIKRAWAGYTFHFDGYRNFGFWTVDLDSTEAPQRALARNIIEGLGKAAIIYDVGANVGFWTIWLHSIMPEGSSIIAFEPDPVNLKFLEMNIWDNALDKVVVVDVALSDSAGTGILHCDETGAMNTLSAGSTNSAGKIVVNTMSLDQAADIYGIPDFVKVDVEGHEYELLKGARNILAKGKTILLLEVTQHGNEILKFLTENGYVVTDLRGHPLQHPEYYVAAYPRHLSHTSRQP
ncbi:hypothetical protein JCM19379_19860 [Methyloparacoccus murrellii]